MKAYRLPEPLIRPSGVPDAVYIVASGDLRPTANQTTWPAQEAFETAVVKALADRGRQAVRAHSYDEAKGHGFIDSQAAGIRIFSGIPIEAPLIVVEAVWQYSHHVLAGLRMHRGPIRTRAPRDRFPRA